MPESFYIGDLVQTQPPANAPTWDPNAPSYQESEAKFREMAEASEAPKVMAESSEPNKTWDPNAASYQRIQRYYQLMAQEFDPPTITIAAVLAGAAAAFVFAGRMLSRR